MVDGRLSLFGESDLDRLEAGVLRILETTGIQVLSDRFLDALERAGAHVDRRTRVVRFAPKQVQELIDERRALAEERCNRRQEPEDRYRPGLGIMICPFIHDYPQQSRRHATRRDLLELVHWADVDVDADRTVGQAVTMSEVDPRIEPIEAYALLLRETSHPQPVAYTADVEQIPHLLELSAVAFGEEVFPTGANFMTSPLTLGDRMARYLLAAIDWGRTEHGTGVMPICGGNAPMTIAGNVVISAAELLGAWLAIKAVQPEATVRGGACNGIIDMRRGVASFGAPEALLADLGVCELFERRFGGRVGVAGGSDYIDARVPGLQAAFEKAEVAMAMAAFTGQSFSIAASGGLDSGKVFSAVQFILEREMGQGLWRLGRGIRVDEETLALETIESVGVGEGKSYLETDHTLRHYRQTWFPTYLARGMWEDDEQEFGHQQRMMDEAYAHYQACLEEYAPPELAVGVGDEIDRIVQAARSALLT